MQVIHTYKPYICTRASGMSTSSFSCSSMNADLRRTYVSQQQLAHNDENKQGECAATIAHHAIHLPQHSLTEHFPNSSDVSRDARFP